MTRLVRRQTPFQQLGRERFAKLHIWIKQDSPAISFPGLYLHNPGFKSLQ